MKEEGFHFSKDYDKFWKIQKNKRYVISSVPGWSTHCDANHLSPIIKWSEVVNDTYFERDRNENFVINYK